MAAYGLEDRFRVPKDCYRILDPAAYNLRKLSTKPEKINKHPFLSSTLRDTSVGSKPYTDNIYDASIKRHIPNATSIRSKVPRFPYQTLDPEKQIEELLCRCGLPCECPVEEEEEPELCQANVRKKLFKGPPPHSHVNSGISMPTPRDHGFDILPDGTSRRLLDLVREECPPFYNATVNYSTDFYHGCKWSKRTGQRGRKSLEVSPGPGDYTVEHEKTLYERCMDAFRAKRCKQSGDTRYMDLLMRRCILDNFPGPGDYPEHHPQKTELQHLGAKADRFPRSKYEIRPDPATYSIKRFLDPPDFYPKACPMRLPEPACFGTKAPRFQYRIREGPGPADYNANVKLCKFQHCSKAGFGVSSERFKGENVLEDEDYFLTDDEFLLEDEEKKECPKHTWQFKSRTKRFKTVKDYRNTKSYLGLRFQTKRAAQLQYKAPFFSSEGRFHPWHDWLPVYTGLETPGPAYYNANKAKCIPAVCFGPVFRDERFKVNRYPNPAPNEYRIGNNDITKILTTHNKRLKDNVGYNRSKQHDYVPPKEPAQLSFKQKETLLLDKAIAECEIERDSPLYVPKEGESKTDTQIAGEEKKEKSDNIKNQKLLRTFLYKRVMPIYF